MSEHEDPGRHGAPNDHAARTAANLSTYLRHLPAWHPVKMLFETARGLREIQAVYHFLRVLAETYAPAISLAHERRLRGVTGTAERPITQEFVRMVLTPHLIRSGRWLNLWYMYQDARQAVELVHADDPPALKAALDALDHTVARILQAVRAVPPPLPGQLSERRNFHLHLVRSS